MIISMAMARVSTAIKMKDIAPLQKLFAWLSPGFPVGSFAYSHGLESAIAEGWLNTAADVQGWIADLLRFGTGRNDAILMAEAWRGWDIDDLALALCGSAERRRETLEQGAALARILQALEGDCAAGPYPVVLAKAAAQAQIPLEVLLTFYLQAFASNLITSCVKSVPLGQTAGQKILAHLMPVIAEVAETALSTTLDDLGSSCFRADLMAIRHETLQPRIYRT